MRENEFERKVQEQMEELRIRPSEETWERVEKELRERKKRRAAILFFVMAGLLLLGYSGYTFLYRSSSQPVAQNEVRKSSAAQPSIINTTTCTTNTTTNKNSAVAEKPGTTPNTNQPDQERNANPSLNQETVKENPVVIEQVHTEKNRQLPIIVNPGKRESIAIAKENAAGNNQKKSTITSQRENKPDISNSSDKAIAGNSQDETTKKPVHQPGDKKEDIILNGIVSNTPINNMEQMSSDTATVIDSTIAKTEGVKLAAPLIEEPKPIAKNKNKSKWKIGVEVSGGFISSQNKVFGFSDGWKSNRLRDPLSSITSPGTSTNAPSGVIIPPSEINEGKSLKLGLVAQRTISRRSSVSAGLRYYYADESLEVGTIKDTVIRSNSYSFSQNYLAVSEVRFAAAPPGRPLKYTNRYHFLEIPLLYQTQLNKGKKMGILWNAGITPGFLIGTNALVYDTAARGVYYKNDNAFKRFHFNLETGFSLQFGNNKKIQWSLGPTVSLDMTRLMRVDVFTEKRYFLYTGLTGRLFLNSRKK